MTFAMNFTNTTLGYRSSPLGHGWVSFGRLLLATSPISGSIGVWIALLQRKSDADLTDSPLGDLSRSADHFIEEHMDTSCKRTDGQWLAVSLSLLYQSYAFAFAWHHLYNPSCFLRYSSMRVFLHHWYYFYP